MWNRMFQKTGFPCHLRSREMDRSGSHLLFSLNLKYGSRYVIHRLHLVHILLITEVVYTLMPCQ